MVTIAALVMIVMLVGTVLVAVLVAVLVLVGWVRGRLTWTAPSIVMHELIAPTGELQDPQFLDERRHRDRSADEAYDTAVAVIGIGIKPFSNRAPLTVQRTERSLRHG